VTSITWTPIPLRTKRQVASEAIAPGPQQEYIRRLWKDLPHDNSLLTELYLTPELAREDSRAKRQARWKAKQVADRALLDQLIAHERKYGRHKSKSAAAAVGVQKWKVQLVEARKAEKLRRRVQRGDVAKQERKMQRKEKKQVKKMERLRALVLSQAPNQVVPTTKPVTA
jgi:hypothetical protein